MLPHAKGLLSKHVSKSCTSRSAKIAKMTCFPVSPGSNKAPGPASPQSLQETCAMLLQRFCAASVAQESVHEFRLDKFETLGQLLAVHPFKSKIPCAIVVCLLMLLISAARSAKTCC